MVLERHLHAHRVAQEHALRGGGRLQDRLQVGRDVVEADPAAVPGDAAAAVPAEVPAHDPVAGSEVAHQVLPGESVAADAVVADQRGTPFARHRIVDAGAVGALGKPGLHTVQLLAHGGKW